MGGPGLKNLGLCHLYFTVLLVVFSRKKTENAKVCWKTSVFEKKAGNNYPKCHDAKDKLDKEIV